MLTTQEIRDRVEEISTQIGTVQALTNKVSKLEQEWTRWLVRTYADDFSSEAVALIFIDVYIPATKAKLDENFYSYVEKEFIKKVEFIRNIRNIEGNWS